MAEVVLSHIGATYGLPKELEVADTTTLAKLTLTGSAGTGIDLGGQAMISTGDVSFSAVDKTVAGIENQNLLDKTAAETITNTYTFEQIDFIAVDDTIAGIENQNLLDKTATETITGAWQYNANITFLDGTIEIAGIQSQNLVDKASTESISGLWTYTTLPQSSVAPTNANDFTNKSYVDGLISGVRWKDPARMGTTQDLASETFGATGVTYANGTAGVGATLTQDDATDGAFGGVDGVTTGLAVGQRVLVKDQTAPAENGIYEITELGDGTTTPWVLTRVEDLDEWDGEVPNATLYVSEGSTQADYQYTCTSNAGGTFGTTAVTWVNTGTGVSFTAGDGIDITTGVISVDVTDIIDTNAGLTENANDIQVNLATASSLGADGGLEFASGAIAVNQSTTIGTNASNELIVNADSITATEIDETGNFTWTGEHTFTNGVLNLPTSADATTPVEGSIYWDGTTDTLFVYDGTAYTEVSGTDSNLLTATNANASAITEGQVVYQTGTANQVDLARCDAVATSIATVGVVDDASIANGASGGIRFAGVKDGYTGLAPGAIYFLDKTTAGAITSTRPNGNVVIVIVGVAISATELLVRVQLVSQVR
jgi:hypothetical protein